MNSYILTFRKKIIFSFLLILGILITLDISLYFIAKIQSTKTTFINDKFSKMIHLKLNNNKGKDIIFIGSSRTFYHISTNTFKKNKLNIYNLGISGAQFEDYPALIPNVNKANTKEIIISLSVNRLYNKLNVSSFPTLKEIEYYYSIDKIKFLQSLKQWIINRHLFLQYSKPIFYKLKSIYRKFDSQQEFQKHEKKTNKNTLNSMKFITNKSINYSTLLGCQVFDKKQIVDTQIILKCSNGDGIIIGNNINKKDEQIKELKNFNHKSIKYLQKTISNINRKKIKLTIILEPIFDNKYTYDFNSIKKQFVGVKIIDLTNFRIKDSFWADNGHLNYKGRELYSQYLLKLLK